MMKERTPPTPKMSPRPPISEKSGASTPVLPNDEADDATTGAFMTEEPREEEEREDRQGEEVANPEDSLDASGEEGNGDSFALVPVEDQGDSQSQQLQQSQSQPSNAAMMASMQQSQQYPQQQQPFMMHPQQMMMMPQWPGQMAQPAFTQPHMQMPGGYTGGMTQMPMMQQMPPPVPQPFQQQMMMTQQSFSQQPMVGQVGVGPMGQPIYGYVPPPPMPMIMGSQQMSFVQQQPMLQQPPPPLPATQTPALSPRRSQSELSNSSVNRKQNKSRKSTLDVVEESVLPPQQPQQPQRQESHQPVDPNAHPSMPRKQSETTFSSNGPLPNYPSFMLQHQQQQLTASQTQNALQQQWNQPWANNAAGQQQWQPPSQYPWQQQSAWQMQQPAEEWNDAEGEEKNTNRPGYPEMKPKGKTDESMKKFVNRMKKVGVNNVFIRAMSRYRKYAEC